MTSVPIPEPPAAEMTALREGAAWARRAGDRLDLVGSDRVRFLHNLITSEVRELAPGASTRGFLTQVKGGVVADAEVVALEDRLRLVLPPGRGGVVRAHLEKYRIAEQVEIEERADLVALVLCGARSPRALAEGGLPAPEPCCRIESGAGAIRVAVRRELRGRGPRFEIELRREDRDAFVAAWRRQGKEVGLTEISAAALECGRVEDGELAWGVDYDETSFPQETGEESAVSYTKGCYLGQEVVARIHYRGGVQRVARRLRFAEETSPEPGVELLFGGRSVGRATTLARSPAAGGLLGLALVHRRAADPGRELATPHGDRVVVLPLEPD